MDIGHVRRVAPNFVGAIAHLAIVVSSPRRVPPPLAKYNRGVREISTSGEFLNTYNQSDLGSTLAI